MTNLTEIFASLSFNDAAMRERLPKDVYTALTKSIEEGSSLDLESANGHRQRDEGLGFRKRRHSFHPLVPAVKRYHSRKT